MKQSSKKKQILGACVGNCVHVAGISNFLQIAKSDGYSTIFLGPAISIEKIIDEIQLKNPEFVALSFRLTPSVGLKLIEELISIIKKKNLDNRIFFLGCLPELRDRVKSMKFFKEIFIGGETSSFSLDLLRNTSKISPKKQEYGTDLFSRLKIKQPKPIYRTHFGLDSLELSLSEISRIAESGQIDVISIAPDQPAQEYFHHPKILNASKKGAGGIPIRSIEDIKAIYEASQLGNKPLLRIYAGTQDLVKNSEIQVKYLHNAWTATPLFWYSDLDGRSKRPLIEAIQENLENIRWHASRNLPVEINDPHQWGLRGAPDHIVVADAYLCARVAKEIGVTNYIQQLMFNTPAGNSHNMDLARVLAMIEIVEPLKSEKFNILKETRAGLSYFSNNLAEAKAQLAISTLFQMAVKPDIMHIVNYCEAIYAAKADDVIESAEIANIVVNEVVNDPVSLTLNPQIQQYKQKLINEAFVTIKAIETLAIQQNTNNPYTSSHFLAQIVQRGLFDAPHLKNNSSNFGKIETRIIGGKCVTIKSNGQILSESERIQSLFPEVEFQNSLMEKKQSPVLE